MTALSRIGGLFAFFKISAILSYLHRRQFEGQLARKFKVPDEEEERLLGDHGVNNEATSIVGASEISQPLAKNVTI